MNTNLDVDWPSEFLPVRERIEQTARPYIEIKAKPEAQLRLWQSKFGGLPYLPKRSKYPKDASGRALLLLAQINFSETPPLEDFPTTGILQFYISNGQDLYGMNFDDLTKQGPFRVLYFPAVVEDERQLLADFSFLPKPDFFPLEESCALQFIHRAAPITPEDYQFGDQIFGPNAPDARDETPGTFPQYDFYDVYEQLFPSEGHRIGGYPYFTQTDPRFDEKYKAKQYRLLFQMDSDTKANILWGDTGVGNFFIQPADLQRLNFSRVLYTWDCC